MYFEVLELSGDADDPSVFVSDLLICLIPLADARSKQIVASAARLVGFMVDQPSFWDTCSRDALLDAPVPKGAKRARILGPVLVDAVAEAAGKGELARTGSRVLANMHRWRRWCEKRMAISTCNTFPGSRAKVYLRQERRQFANAKVRILSLALDASRMGHRGTLYLAMYSPELDRAAWCPPQAL